MEPFKYYMAEANQKRRLVAGVDLGGTKILAGIFDAQMTCLGRAKVTTKPERGFKEVVGRICRCVEEAVDECDLEMSQIQAVGIGAPGAVDTDTGEVVFAPNLDWHEAPLAEALRGLLKLPVRVENDCNAATLGVHRVEFGGTPRNLIGIFLGTGIGGGFIVNGELYCGASHAAGEIGHMVIDVGGPKCACGNSGCFEALASRTAIFKKLQKAIAGGQESLLADLLGADLKGMRSGDLRKAIQQGDKLARQVIMDAADVCGIAIANLVNCCNPEVVVLGGGLIEALENEMTPVIIKSARDHFFTGNQNVQIAVSRLGDDAGIIGAAVLARGLAV